MSSREFTRTNIFYPTQPTPFQRFLRNPPLFLATWLYTHQPPLAIPSKPPNQPIRVVLVSDTHNETPDVPPGDILIHAGDMTQNGTFVELQAQLTWLRSLTHAHKLVIAGNHDLILDEEFVARASDRVFTTEDRKRKQHLDWGDVVYLEDTLVTVMVQDREVKVYGAPFTPKYGNWAFQYARQEDVWRGTIPRGTDIVVTHGPIKGHLDRNSTGNAGCPHLNGELRRVKPRLAVCGHIHEARGREDLCWDAVQKMHDGATGCPVGGSFVFVAGMLGWTWAWLLWIFNVRRRAKTTLVNASMVGSRGIAEGIVVEL